MRRVLAYARMLWRMPRQARRQLAAAGLHGLADGVAGDDARAVRDALYGPLWTWFPEGA